MNHPGSSDGLLALCLSLCLCVSVFSCERHNVQILRASLSETYGIHTFTYTRGYYLLVQRHMTRIETNKLHYGTNINLLGIAENRLAGNGHFREDSR